LVRRNQTAVTDSSSGGVLAPERMGKDRATECYVLIRDPAMTRERETLRNTDTFPRPPDREGVNTLGSLLQKKGKRLGLSGVKPRRLIVFAVVGDSLSRKKGILHKERKTATPIKSLTIGQQTAFRRRARWLGGRRKGLENGGIPRAGGKGCAECRPAHRRHQKTENSLRPIMFRDLSQKRSDVKSNAAFTKRGPSQKGTLGRN